MVNSLAKAGVAVALFMASIPLAASQNRAEDPAAGSQAQYKTASYQAAQQPVATTTNNNKSDNTMSPVPETGTMAMLITGICMFGFAARRHKIAA